MQKKGISVEIISIGDELLYGQTLDTNAHWISGELAAIGMQIVRRQTVSDKADQITKSIREALLRADVVITTGGLGPTNDDITKKNIAEILEKPLVLHQPTMDHLEVFFQKRGRTLNELNKTQAFVPKDCRVFTNENGTAPGMWNEFEGKIIASFPGVPHEMKQLVSNGLIPAIKTHFDLPVIYHRIMHTVGIPEAVLAEKISDWESKLPKGVGLAYLPSLGTVKLRLTASGTIKEQLVEQINTLESAVLPLIDKYIFGFDNITLEQALGNFLLQQNATVSTAESCTGGNIGARLTSVAGSSSYFLGGTIVYSNEAKIKQLGVDPQLIQTHGAVSEEVAHAMALGAQKSYQSTYAIAATGVAGPGGGSVEKPVGTVWIACAGPNGVRTKKLQLTDKRHLNIELSTVAALDLLRKTILTYD